MKKVLKKMVGLLMAVMMIGSMLVCSVSAAENFEYELAVDDKVPIYGSCLAHLIKIDDEVYHVNGAR